MSEAGTPGERLNGLLRGAGLEPLDGATAARFDLYLSLLLRWGRRINLTALRDEDSILARHFLESIACARALPSGLGTLLDFGSGAGLPGIPIALCRPETLVTLAESQNKKAAFLQEAVRSLGLSAHVFAGRAETLTLQFDCVTMRAVDRMPEAVGAAVSLIRAGGSLALMTSDGELEGLKVAAGAGFSWDEPVRLPGGDRRLLAIGVKAESGESESS